MGFKQLKCFMKQFYCHLNDLAVAEYIIKEVLPVRFGKIQFDPFMDKCVVFVYVKERVCVIECQVRQWNFVIQGFCYEI